MIDKSSGVPDGLTAVLYRRSQGAKSVSRTKSSIPLRIAEKSRREAQLEAELRALPALRRDLGRSAVAFELYTVNAN